MDRITVKEAAALMGSTEQWIRLKCRSGMLGDAYGSGKKNRHYMISPAAVCRWNGWTTEQFFSELDALRKEQGV